MVRSMYSGVSGLRAHQTRMDTIGNNIANVNTYGYKSSRTTFRDIYYQSIANAKSPSAQSGGKNASQVGYGAKVGSVDLNMGRSTFSTTDQTMDVAIDGEGFLQVQDSSGNTYYTRAGLLNFDASGNLVDMQGNYVLGVNGNPTGRDPGSERISVSLPSVSPKAASATQSINGTDFTIKASNSTMDGNVSFTFASSSTMTDGVKAQAKITNTGVTITFNANEKFGTWADVNAAINDAIKEANGGEDHVAGKFTISTNATMPAGGLSGAELAGSNYGTNLGNINGLSELFGGIVPTGVVGTMFGKDFAANPQVTDIKCTLTSANVYTIEATIGGETYTGTIDNTDGSKDGSGKFNLYASNGDTKDFVEFKRPVFTAITAGTETGLTVDAVASKASNDVGLSSMDFLLRGGTGGGAQTIADMTGIYIGADGIIVGLDSEGTEVLIGRIDLATFANASGLMQHGTTSFAQSMNSGEAVLGQPGVGGTGQLVSGTLELSNVDLSQEFSDMITTQRGYQANSRIITVSDSMLEELINLKR